jgi:fatty-acyl-CoA synthase
MKDAVGANPYRHSTLAGLLDAAAARFGPREALVLGERRWNYADFHREVRRLARGLLALGVAPGDAVALWLTNRPEWLVVQHACGRVGAVVVALNTRYRTHELAYILRQSDTTILVLQDHALHIDFLEILGRLLPGLAHANPDDLRFEAFPRLRRVICVSEDVYGGTVAYRDVVEAGDDPALDAALRARERQVRPDDVFTVLYTSGTTSFPKGVMISHENAVPHGWAAGERLGLTERDRVLHTLPFSGTWGGLVIPIMTLSHGACLVLEEFFDALLTLRLLETEAITVWNAVDAMLTAVLDHPDFDRYDRRALRTGGVAMTGGGRHGLFDEVVERLGMRGAVQPYGMTEVNALALCPYPDDPLELRRRAGVRPAPGLEVRVVDPDSGVDRAAGEAGELWLRGPLVTRGYYKKPEETAAAIDPDGWLHTGDLAVRDEHGHTYFLGRLKETLRISHFMVAPAEIEAFLMRHPAVGQGFVVGVPDPRLGEAAVAYVVPRPGEHPTEAELQDYCRAHLAAFKVPRRVFVVDDVSRTPGPHGDKVQRVKLREQARKALGLEP